MTTPATHPRARRRARRALLQALYAWQMTDVGFADLRAQFSPDKPGDSDALDGSDLRGADIDYFLACLRGVMDMASTLDALFAPHLDRAVDRLDPVERAVLRAGAYELKERRDVPARVVIAEWVAIAKSFGATDSFRYVNGVLDRVARALRPGELAGGEPGCPPTSSR